MKFEEKVVSFYKGAFLFPTLAPSYVALAVSIQHCRMANLLLLRGLPVDEFNGGLFPYCRIHGLRNNTQQVEMAFSEYKCNRPTGVCPKN